MIERLDDPDYVREQYASEAGLEARRSIYRDTTGPDAREVAFEAVAELRPRRVLEVGCGPGEASARMAAELAAHVSAIDVSQRMVELARGRGVDAQVGDVQHLPFSDEEFDCALAAWVLFHVRELDQALGELARVLRRGGRLVAATNSNEHLAEVWRLVGREPLSFSFASETGEELLARHFGSVERREVIGTLRLGSETLRSYLASSNRGKPYVELVPELDEPLVATRRHTVFVATR